MLSTPFYNPQKTYYENFDAGPSGAFTDGTIIESRGEPTNELFGHKIFTPIGIPAGPLLNSKFIIAALDKGFDIPMQKTVRTRKKICHPWPNVLAVKVEGDLTMEKAGRPLTAVADYTEPLSITNSFGNPSYGPDFWQEDIGKAVKHAKRGQVVSASFEGTRWEGFGEKEYVGDWVLGARLLKETGVGFIEANLSCPNEGTTALLCHDSEKVQKISDAIKNAIGDFPLMLKISYFADDASLETLVKKVGSIVSGFAAINTISAEVVGVDGKQALPGEGRLRSGVCGHAIKWAGLDMVRRLKRFREELELSYAIFGVGGVTHVQDYKEYREMGADVVMTATGAMWNPFLAKEVKEQGP